MPNTAGFAAALTVRESTLRAAVQAAYANGSDSGKRFDQDISGDGIGMVTSLFLGGLDIDLEGATNLLVVTLPMWGQVTTTVDQLTHIVEMNGVMQLTLTPAFKKGIKDTDSEFSILLDQVDTVVTARSWSATVTSAATPPNVAALITGDAFRTRFGHKFAQGVLVGLVKLPSIDGSFLGALVPKSAEILGRVREGVLLIGLSYGDETHDLHGNVDALQDFAGSNDVAGAVAPEAVDIMIDKLHTKLVEGVEDAGASLSGFQVRPRNGYFLVSGRASQSSGSVDFSFRLVPSLFHTRPGAFFQYLEKPVRAKSRTWAALEFSITDVETDVDRAWWVVLFGEVILGILTVGLADLYIEGLISAAAGPSPARSRPRKWTDRRRASSGRCRPPGGISTRIAPRAVRDRRVRRLHRHHGALQADAGEAARADRAAGDLSERRGCATSWRRLPVWRTAIRALRMRWTLQDRTNNVVLWDQDGAGRRAAVVRVLPRLRRRDDFTITGRLYRQLGVAVTDLSTLSVNLHMRAALAPSAYTRWRWQGTNPQVGVDQETGNWFYNGEKRVDRWSEWHRTDAPCRSGQRAGPLPIQRGEGRSACRSR